MKIQGFKRIAFHLFLMTLVFTGEGYAGELMTKVMQNDLEGVKTLLASGAKIDEKDATYGSTPLLMACNYGYVEMAELLVNRGADINIKAKNGATPLILAAASSEKLAKLLLSKKADIHAKMSDGTGGFTWCITGILSERVSLDFAKFLLEKGANVNEAVTGGFAPGYTPLMMAARNNRVDLVRFLIDNGADLGARAKDGMTALQLARKEGHGSVADILKA